MTSTSSDEHHANSLTITRGLAEILPGGDAALAELLSKAQSEHRQLRIKLGIDPTAPDLHIGHTVCLQVLRRFQELGHKTILLIGGFTAQLGDPTGRNEARPSLTAQQVASCTQEFLRQAGKVLDLSKTEIVNNADWLTKLNLADVLKLASGTTINRLIGKEAFGERLGQGHPLFLHEVFYPILQGYDSVILRADVEIGGQDQMFNVLAGREMQKQHGQSQQLALLMPLLIGLDGKKKMSKTADNHIGLNDEPADIYGKTMSLPDALLMDWFKLALSSDASTLSSIETQLSSGANPRDIKMQLARELVSLYHSPQLASYAEEDFRTKFQRREPPEQIEEYQLTDTTNIVEVLVISGLMSSKGEARRMIAGGGVQVNGHKATAEYTLQHGDILQIGKRKFLRTIESNTTI